MFFNIPRHPFTMCILTGFVITMGSNSFLVRLERSNGTAPAFPSPAHSRQCIIPAQVTAFYLLLGGVALAVPLVLATLRAATRPCWSRRSARVRARVRASARCLAALLLVGAGGLSAHLATLAPPGGTVRFALPAAAGGAGHPRLETPSRLAHGGLELSVRPNLSALSLLLRRRVVDLRRLGAVKEWEVR